MSTGPDFLTDPKADPLWQARAIARIVVDTITATPLGDSGSWAADHFLIVGHIAALGGAVIKLADELEKLRPPWSPAPLSDHPLADDILTGADAPGGTK